MGYSTKLYLRRREKNNVSDEDIEMVGEMQGREVILFSGCFSFSEQKVSDNRLLQLNQTEQQRRTILEINKSDLI